MSHAMPVHAPKWEIFEDLMASSNEDTLKLRTSKLLHGIGMDNFGYARLAGVDNAPYEQRHFSLYDYTGMVATHYSALRDQARTLQDPRVLHSRANLPALPWNARGEFGYAPPRGAEQIFASGRRLIMNAADYGASAGITVPCWSSGTRWGFSTFSSNQTHDLQDMQNLAPILVYLAHCLHCIADRLTRQPVQRIQLSERERDILCWSAMGKTSWEISQIEKISESTVNFHLQRAAAKLGVRGRRSAVAQAIASGLITL